MGKAAKESDVATAVCFLASDAAGNDNRNIFTYRWWLDSKIMQRILLIIAILFSTNVFSAEFNGKFIQGHFIIGKTRCGFKSFHR